MNKKEMIIKNTYNLNSFLHIKDIDEGLRSQFVGTLLIYLQTLVNLLKIINIDESTRGMLNNKWNNLSKEDIVYEIKIVVTKLLEHDDDSSKKIVLLVNQVFDNEKVQNLSKEDWVEILDNILWNIYQYIDINSREGQDVLNLFYITFNKYIGRADKNQAFTPDHITHLMTKVTGINKDTRVLDGTCGSGSFLIQSIIQKMNDVYETQNYTIKPSEVKNQVYGIEIEDKAYGLSITNMLMHEVNNSNIANQNIFESAEFIKEADPDVILMNPPYNAKPLYIPEKYKNGWGDNVIGDQSKGLVFLQYISDVIKEMNDERIANGKGKKEVKVAILLPVSVAIGVNNVIKEMKKEILKDNRLDAVFSLPDKLFYPGAYVSVCCMLFTLGVPHIDADGNVTKTYFGYYKEDGHKEKRNQGRVELYDNNGNSLWNDIEKEWLELYKNKEEKLGISVIHEVTGEDRWLAETYMETDMSNLSDDDFEKTINKYIAYLVEEGIEDELEKISNWETV